MVSPDNNLRPQLAVDIVHYLAPFCTPVVKEVVEHVLMAAYELEERTVGVVCRIGDREAGEHQQKLKDTQGWIQTIVSRLLKSEWTQI